MTHLDLRTQRLTTPSDSTSSRFYIRFGKRLLDITLALALLPILTLPILFFWAIARQNGPGFFAHNRIGKNRVQFKCWKIRTMTPDASARLVAYLESNPAANAEWAETQKLKNDPRVTSFGHFLRRTSLDELPQIWNVLRGEMSFVGPRPVTEDELSRYGQHIHSYLSVKPGVTGYWQVHGRSGGCYKERLNMDQKYISNITPLQDLWLIASTALVIIRSTGR